MGDGGVRYIFLDEGGNLDFSNNGTKYFTLTGVMMARPFPLDRALTELRFDIIEEGQELEEFHATEDLQATRNRVFANINGGLSALRVDSIVVEKRKTHPKMQEIERFYPKMLRYLLRWTVQKESLGEASEVIVVTDELPHKKKRKAIEGAVKKSLKEMLPSGVKYRVMHHDSKSCIPLQVADYLNWAIYRKWNSGDDRSYRLIEAAVKSEFRIFKHGFADWY